MGDRRLMARMAPFRAALEGDCGLSQISCITEIGLPPGRKLEHWLAEDRSGRVACWIRKRGFRAGLFDFDPWDRVHSGMALAAERARGVKELLRMERFRGIPASRGMALDGTHYHVMLVRRTESCYRVFENPPDDSEIMRWINAVRSIVGLEQADPSIVPGKPRIAGQENP